MYPYFELANIVMAYVLGSTIAGVRFGRGPAIVAAVANVLAFDFCFVPPRYTFSVSDFQYLVTFAVMLIVTLVIANLMASVRQQTRVAGARERRTALLYAMSRELAATRGVDEHGAGRGPPRRRSVRLQGCRAAAGCERTTALSARSAARRIVRQARICRSRNGSSITASVQDSAPIRCRPRRRCMCRLSDERQRLGVLAVLPENRRRILLPEQRHLLETFAGQLGLAMERAQLAEQAETARVAAETESLRNTLLASISHDLRTPLAVIAGASSTLAEHGARSRRQRRARRWRARSRPRPATCRSWCRTCST